MNDRCPVSEWPQALALAIGEYEAGRTASAREALLQLVGAHPNEGAPLRALGAVLCNEGNFEDAIPVLEQAATADPGDSATKAYLAMALLLGRQDVVGAQERIREAVAQAPGSFVVRWKHGELLLRLGYAREAAAELQAALQADAPDAASRTHCADMLRVAERRAEGQVNRVAPSFPPQVLRDLFSGMRSLRFLGHPARREV